MLSFIPSPVEFEYDKVYSAVTNKSGRMQYYLSSKNGMRIRISRNEFTQIYNSSEIVAIKPIQDNTDQSNIQLNIYVKQPTRTNSSKT